MRRRRFFYFLNIAFCAVWMIGISGNRPASAESEDESRLRKVEDKIGRSKETASEGAAQQSRQGDNERRRQEEREKWRREHPGEPVPDWVGQADDDLLWEDLTWIALAVPFAGPYYLLDDDYREPLGFSAYPFADDADGCTLRDGRTWMVNSNLSMQRLPGNILTSRGDFTLNFWRRFAFEGAYSKYEERLKNRTEILALGEGLMTFTFARNDFLDFRAGVGVQMIDGKNVNHGVKWAYRVRWFHRPIQLNLDIGMTTGLGASSLSEIMPGVGIHLGRFEYKLGYRRLKISGDRLAGPEFAVRVWF